MRLKHLLGLAILVFMPQVLGEESTGLDAGYLLGMAATTGGDKLLEVDVIFDDGDTNSNNVKAGALLYFYGGINITKPESPWSAQFTLGYHFDGVFTKDDSVKFSRFPLDILLTRQFNSHALSIGLTRHFSPELDAKDLDLDTVDFNDATGTLIQYQYFTDTGQAIGIRYTMIDYTTTEEFGDFEIDGNSIGLMLTGYF